MGDTARVLGRWRRLVSTAFDSRAKEEIDNGKIQKIGHINSHINHRSSNGHICFRLGSSRHMPKTSVLRTAGQVWEKHKCFDYPVPVFRNGQVDASS